MENDKLNELDLANSVSDIDDIVKSKKKKKKESVTVSKTESKIETEIKPIEKTESDIINERMTELQNKAVREPERYESFNPPPVLESGIPQKIKKGILPMIKEVLPINSVSTNLNEVAPINVTPDSVLIKGDTIRLKPLTQREKYIPDGKLPTNYEIWMQGKKLFDSPNNIGVTLYDDYLVIHGRKYTYNGITIVKK